eukprot:Rhum_TRINITY_DN20829_c0_g1::Rhum_TRINITY_DN20829_c0_g1_i1::g.172356::m.172356/K03953/NDUFA9; NADH dehydrogenase (ubiquinone) 1 alpha subcomplex subunit 9
MSRLLLTTASQMPTQNTNLFGNIATVFGGYGTVGLGISHSLAKHGSVLMLPYRKASTDHRQFHLASQDPWNYHPLFTDFNKPGQLRQVIEPADFVVVSIGRRERPNTPLRWRELGWGYDAVGRQLPVDIAKLCKETGKETMVYISRIGADVDSESEILRAHGRAEVEIREIMPSAIIIRPSDVFSLQGDKYTDLFRNIARMAYKNAVVYPEMLSRKSEPVFTGDIGVACARALQDPEAWGKTYELGGRQEFTYQEILEFVHLQTGNSLNTFRLPFQLAKMWGTFEEMTRWHSGYPKDYWVRMQYNAIANEKQRSDIYGWEDLGIDPRQLILLEETAPDALYNWNARVAGTIMTKDKGSHNTRFLH